MATDPAQPTCEPAITPQVSIGDVSSSRRGSRGEEQLFAKRSFKVNESTVPILFVRAGAYSSSDTSDSTLRH